MDAQQEYYISLVKRLRNLPNEREWLEFKVDNNDPKIIGEYISALSNSASICDKDKAYIIWGIEDRTHDIVGTQFKPKQFKIGNEELENWLLRLLKPRVDFHFVEVSMNDKKHCDIRNSTCT